MIIPEYWSQGSLAIAGPERKMISKEEKGDTGNTQINEILNRGK
jgi:hypothetical protein